MQCVCVLLLMALIVSACGAPRAELATPTLDAPTPLNSASRATDALPSPTTLPEGVATRIIPNESTPRSIEASPRIADQLPLDQPWVLSSETLIAVSDEGELTQLDVPVSDVLIAADGSPLIIARPSDNQYTLRNTQTWRDRPLDMPDGLMLQPEALLAPDGSHFAFFAWSQTGQGFVLMVDSATGAVRTLIVETLGDTVSPIAWNGNILFTHTQRSATSYFWRTDTAAQEPKPQEILLIGHTGSWSMALNGTALAWSYLGNPLSLRDLDTNIDYELNVDALPLISPDGNTLVLKQGRDTGGCCALRFLDLSTKPPTPIGQPVEIDSLTYIQGFAGWEWSRDSTWLMIITSTQVSLIEPNGSILGRADLPSTTIFTTFRLADDDRFLLISHDEAKKAKILYTISLTGSEPKQWNEVRLPDMEGAYTIVYLPLGATDR